MKFGSFLATSSSEIVKQIYVIIDLPWNLAHSGWSAIWNTFVAQGQARYFLPLSRGDSRAKLCCQLEDIYNIKTVWQTRPAERSPCERNRPRGLLTHLVVVPQEARPRPLPMICLPLVRILLGLDIQLPYHYHPESSRSSIK